MVLVTILILALAVEMEFLAVLVVVVVQSTNQQADPLELEHNHNNQAILEVMVGEIQAELVEIYLLHKNILVLVVEVLVFVAKDILMLVVLEAQAVMVDNTISLVRKFITLAVVEAPTIGLVA